MVTKGTANVMAQKPASQKSNMLIQVLQSQGVQGFQTFLEVCATETEPKYKEPSMAFLSMASIFPGYEEWSASHVSDEREGMTIKSVFVT